MPEKDGRRRQLKSGSAKNFCAEKNLRFAKIIQKTSFYKNLDEAKESGKITQEQYDYWKNLVEQNLPA